MFLRFILVLIGIVLLGLFVNYYMFESGTCKSCIAKKKTATAWDNLAVHASTERLTPQQQTSVIDSILDDE